MSLIVLLSILDKCKDFYVFGEGARSCKGIDFLGLGMGIGILDLCGLANRPSNCF